jgi:hypothetical protein
MRTPKLDDEVLMSELLETYLDVAKELMPVPSERKEATPASTPSRSTVSSSQSSTIEALAGIVPTPTCILTNLVTWTKVRNCSV